MCLKTRRILLIEAPAISTEKLSKIFPAGYLPSTNGWLLHVNGFPTQFGHCCITVTIVPFFTIVTFGLLVLHLKQIIDNSVNKEL